MGTAIKVRYVNRQNDCPIRRQLAGVNGITRSAKVIGGLGGSQEVRLCRSNRGGTYTRIRGGETSNPPAFQRPITGGQGGGMGQVTVWEQEPFKR